MIKTLQMIGKSYLLLCVTQFSNFYWYPLLPIVRCYSLLAILLAIVNNCYLLAFVTDWKLYHFILLKSINKQLVYVP